MIELPYSFQQIRKDLSKKDKKLHDAYVSQCNSETVMVEMSEENIRTRSRQLSQDDTVSMDSVMCVFCGMYRSMHDKNIRAAGAKITNKVNSAEDKEHVKKITREWRQLAEDINHPGLISEIGTNSNPTGGVRSSELFYDLSCFVNAKRKQARKAHLPVHDNHDFIEMYTMKQITAYIESCSHGNAFKLYDLWSMYSAILMRFAIETNYKSTAFYDKLQLELPTLKKYHHGHGSAIYVTLERNINKEMFESQNSEEEYEVSEIFTFLRLATRNLGFKEAAI